MTTVAMTVALLAAPAVRAQVGLVEAGRDVFSRQCADCHGQGGAGYGRASWVLKEQPPDLTVLSSRTTPFPRTHVRNVVTGHIRLIPSHGRSEMPYWRADSKTIDGSGGLTEMDALLAFIEHVQIRPYRAAPGPSPEEIAAAGATLFAQRCASCHERGWQRPEGILVLGIAPPDLTMLHGRYAGPMDARRIYELIARCGEKQTTDMPSWYRSMRQAGWTRATTMKELEAIAAFVESVQRR